MKTFFRFYVAGLLLLVVAFLYAFITFNDVLASNIVIFAFFYIGLLAAAFVIVAVGIPLMMLLAWIIGK